MRSDLLWCLPAAQHLHTVGLGLQSEDPYDSGINLQLIQTLLNNFGPLVVGGPNNSLTLTQAQCVADLLPGIGYPSELAACQQMNCVGCNPAGPDGMKNTLATNAIAFLLNIRYNVQYNGLNMQEIRNQGWVVSNSTRTSSSATMEPACWGYSTGRATSTSTHTPWAA
ncbi:MAG: hypothetical protein IPM82_32420 [Saprospiraceae bacterium]|nr:hypothetical protein [Saprospiraceae bacterium]